MAQNKRTGKRPGTDRRPQGAFSQQDVLRGAASRYRKRRFGTSGIAVILCAVLFVSVVAASVYHIASMERPQKDRQDDIAESIISENTDEAVEDSFEYVSVFADEVSRGDLILVNYEHEFVSGTETDALVNIFENKSNLYGVAYNDYQINGDVLKTFDTLTSELNAITDDASLLVNSAYRSVEAQQKLYDDYLVLYGEDYVKEYVATPGFSEHHTGLAFDLTVRYPDGTYVKMENYEHYALFNTLAIKHGFVQRYPANKFSYTRISTEPWHYRYVGVPHSYVIGKSNLCLEEYISLVQTHTTDTEMLFIDGDGVISTVARDKLSSVDTGYVIYYVAVGDELDVSLPIPKDADSYTVSGDNVGGFVVSAVFGDPTLPEVTFGTIG